MTLLVCIREAEGLIPERVRFILPCEEKRSKEEMSVKGQEGK